MLINVRNVYIIVKMYKFNRYYMYVFKIIKIINSKDLVNKIFINYNK